MRIDNRNVVRLLQTGVSIETIFSRSSAVLRTRICRLRLILVSLRRIPNFRREDESSLDSGVLSSDV
jgi:hypothetical protein